MTGLLLPSSVCFQRPHSLYSLSVPLHAISIPMQLFVSAQEGEGETLVMPSLKSKLERGASWHLSMCFNTFFLRILAQRRDILNLLSVSNCHLYLQLVSP